jgi:hypothetical protein
MAHGSAAAMKNQSRSDPRPALWRQSTPMRLSLIEIVRGKL